MTAAGGDPASHSVAQPLPEGALGVEGQTFRTLEPSGGDMLDPCDQDQVHRRVGPDQDSGFADDHQFALAVRRLGLLEHGLRPAEIQLGTDAWGVERQAVIHEALTVMGFALVAGVGVRRSFILVARRGLGTGRRSLTW